MSKRPFLWIILALLGVVLPFLDKPVHIDDTFVLHVSEQIIERPWDPFAGDYDWFGHFMPVWKATTNPPLISYWLAPVMRVAGRSEVSLHLAVIPFYLLLAWGAFQLAHRFTARAQLATLFFLMSSAVLVSGNLMRDIPAAGLAVAGVAFSFRALERDTRRDWILAGLLLGFSVLAKYSIGVVIPVVAGLTILKRKPGKLLWLLIPTGVVGLWCLHTWLVYGHIHPLYLLLERSSQSGISSADKFFGGLAILGASLWLQPLVVLGLVYRRAWATGLACLALVISVGTWSHWFYGAELDTGFQAWVALGLILLTGSVRLVPVEKWSPEVQFLILWVLAQFLFSCFFVPFQAVRHLIVPLLPLVLLIFRGIEQRPGWGQPALLLARVLLVVQAALALLVHAADYEYANSYRHFSNRIEVGQAEAGKVWFVGHWGWKFYAENAGFEMLHRDGPYPLPGDLLVWPRKVHIGDVFSENTELRSRLLLLESSVYPGRIPVRTMSMDSRAGFYAVIRRRIPFRFVSGDPLEEFRVYRVLPEAGAIANR